MKKLTITTPLIMTLLTACVGGTNSELSETTPSPASVVLTAGQTANVTDVEAVKAYDFANSAVGATVRITGGDLAGVELTVAEPVAGKPSLILKAPNTDLESITAAVGNINTWIDAGVTLMGVDEEDNGGRLETINGKSIWFGEEQKSLGTTRQSEGYISIETGNNTSVEGYVAYSQIAGDTSLVIGGTRYDETELRSAEYSTPNAGGTYQYTGAAVMFAEDESSYSTNTAQMAINFDNDTGTFSANNFQPDEGAPAKNISITSNLQINNISGSISSTDGTITAGNESNNIALNGVIAFDNSAVAGGLIPEAPTDGIVGGVYALPKD